jgi:hypothetical protein
MKRTAIPIAVVLLTACGSCSATSRLYWGYWFGLPSASWMLSSIASVERFTTFDCCDAGVGSSGRQAVRMGAELELYGSGHWPRHNLPAALVKQRLQPTTANEVPAPVLASVRRSLESNGALIEGGPGYPFAKTLWGHVAVGQRTHGGSVVIAALWGGEVSNDHRPYYEALLATLPTGELQLLEVRQYWFDVAGLEGLAHVLAGLGGGILAGVACIAYSIVRHRRAA